MPVYTDTDWDVDFKQMRDAGFATKLLPKSFEGVCGIVAASKLAIVSAKLGIFHIRRLKNFSGVVIFASIAHAIVDAYGYFAFMSRWAELSKWTQQNVGNTTPPVPTRAFVFDRSIHASYKINNTDALDNLTLESMANGSISTRFFAWLPIDKRNLLLKYMLILAEIIAENLSAVAASIRNAIAATDNDYVGQINYLINSVSDSHMRLVASYHKYKNRVTVSNASADWWSRPVPSAVRAAFGAKLGEHTGFLTTVAVNIRPRIEHTGTDNYMGNMSLGKYIWFPQDMVQGEPTDKALSALALKTHQAVSDVDKEYIGQFGHLLNKEPDSYMRLTLCNAKHRRKLVISTQVRFAHYKVDFGAETPLLVRFTPYAFPDVVLVMPGNPEIGGYEITLNLAPEIAAHVIQDAGWMKMVDKYDCII
ncbi:hypothetical protein EV177_004420 [Coemansia sp. RSA 1804]|nr:hypothetical protein EV177_004420 [Coemansia sp. RSA 1804]